MFIELSKYAKDWERFGEQNKTPVLIDLRFGKELKAGKYVNQTATR